MKPRAFLLIALLALVLALGGCTLRQPGGDDTNAVSPPDDGNGGGGDGGSGDGGAVDVQPAVTAEIAACKALGAETQRDTCLLNLAKSAKTDSPCAEITLISKDRCYGEAAKASLLMITCGKIQNQLLKNQCYNDVARGAKTTAACGEITDALFRDDCVKAVAEANRSGEQCAEIFDSTRRNDCYINVAAATHDDSHCGRIGTRQDSRGYERDRCYYAAKDPPDGMTCFSILDEDGRGSCFLEAPDDANENTDCTVLGDEGSVNDCRYWVATSTLQVSVCLELPYERSNQCIDAVLEATPAAEQCALLDDIDEANACYYEAAVEGESDAPCTQISGDPPLKDICFQAIAIQKSDRDICKNMRLNNFSGRDDCFSTVAVGAKDYSTCEYVTADKGYNTCFAEVAAEMNLPEICGQAARSRLKVLPYHPSQYCYMEYALLESDSLGCTLISVPNLRNDCYVDYAMQENDVSVCVHIPSSDTNRLAECRKADD